MPGYYKFYEFQLFVFTDILMQIFQWLTKGTKGWRDNYHTIQYFLKGYFKNADSLPTPLSSY